MYAMNIWIFLYLFSHVHRSFYGILKTYWRFFWALNTVPCFYQVLIEGIPRTALQEDVERFLSGTPYEASSIKIFMKLVPSIICIIYLTCIFNWSWRKFIFKIMLQTRFHQNGNCSISFTNPGEECIHHKEQGLHSKRSSLDACSPVMCFSFFIPSVSVAWLGDIRWGQDM